jgi:hypothetical protein
MTEARGESDERAIAAISHTSRVGEGYCKRKFSQISSCIILLARRAHMSLRHMMILTDSTENRSHSKDQIDQQLIPCDSSTKSRVRTLSALSEALPYLKPGTSKWLVSPPWLGCQWVVWY